MKRRDSSKDDPSVTSPSTTVISTPVTSPPPSLITDEPLVSERAGYGDHESDSQEDARRVQFTRKNGGPTAQKAEIVDIPENDSYDEDQTDDHRKRKG